MNGHGSKKNWIVNLRCSTPLHQSKQNSQIPLKNKNHLHLVDGIYRFRHTSESNDPRQCEIIFRACLRWFVLLFCFFCVAKNWIEIERWYHKRSANNKKKWFLVACISVHVYACEWIWHHLFVSHVISIIFRMHCICSIARHNSDNFCAIFAVSATLLSHLYF